MPEFGDYAQKALIALEKEGAVCSFCGKTLPSNYYLLLSAWRSKTKELVSPRIRFCGDCWQKIEHVVYSSVRQVAMLGLA